MKEVVFLLCWLVVIASTWFIATWLHSRCAKCWATKFGDGKNSPVYGTELPNGQLVCRKCYEKWLNRP